MFNAVVDGVSQIISWAFVGEPESPAQPTGTSRHDHQPTPTEIVLVRSMMCRACRLPPDIVDAVFDHAGYWARSRNRIDFEEEHRDPLRIVGGSREENKFLVSDAPDGSLLARNPAPALPRLTVTVKTSSDHSPWASPTSTTGRTSQRCSPTT